MANLSALFGNKPFNPADVEETESNFDPLPKGDYIVQITDSELAPNKNNTGTNLTLKLVVQEGKFKNRILFDNLCVQHQNVTAQNIAQTRLKRISEALGLKQIKDTSQLHDQNLSLSLDIEFDLYATNKRNDGERMFRNAIKSYGPAPKVKSAPAVEADYDDDVPF